MSVNDIAVNVVDVMSNVMVPTVVSPHDALTIQVTLEWASGNSQRQGNIGWGQDVALIHHRSDLRWLGWAFHLFVSPVL